MLTPLKHLQNDYITITIITKTMTYYSITFNDITITYYSILLQHNKLLQYLTILLYFCKKTYVNCIIVLTYNFLLKYCNI